ncbi:3-deoxy-manno-octulosonate cytidylyltransferase [Rheinheimera maricola]|uniref:3-deoxy-manno-octulosonate cytidylyltransferase n=1 Tax=Rheinheimera maricola TaxID=2793282 RepID=A0ABS7X587_9GAMM|nr:3-deoxy-manno-octulosonate cytidylyltransferase [Rheinheimera maricola]MBZ9610325.1 3-deoxy-manno-octulosonate cytidylyltransferase [Rheinheimera maricola]
MRAVVLIPARYASSRYPGKPLVPLLGKPMVLWVAELSAKAVGKDNVYVATEDSRIADVVTAAGYNAVMTTDSCLTGTDRLAEAALQVKADIYINVQGDEPIINPEDIRKAIDIKKHDMSAIVNGFCWISESENPESVNIPKVITREDNTLVYMSRKALPGFKDDKCAPKRYKKQVCIYAFTAEELAAFKAFCRKSELEFSEDIEILRFLELGKTIRMYETQPGSLAVDVPDDVAPVEAALRGLHRL